MLVRRALAGPAAAGPTVRFVCPHCGEASDEASWKSDEVEITREQDPGPHRILVHRICPACETPSELTTLELGAIDS